MLEILTSPDHVVAAKVSGTLEAEDYDRVIGEVEAKLARFDKIGLMMDLTGFDDVTFEAGMKDAGYGFKKIMEWNRFPREAIGTDKKWIRGMTDMFNPIIPFVDMKTFAPGEQAEAMAWAADIEVKRRPGH